MQSTNIHIALLVCLTCASFHILVKATEDVTSSNRYVCDDVERKLAPNSCHVMDRARSEPQAVVKDLTEWGTALGYVDNTTNFNNVDIKYTVKPVGNKGFTFEGNRTDIVLPIVTQGGLFETCFLHPLPGWVKLAAETTGGYATCINIGNNATDEFLNTIFLNMDATVDEFARKVRNDPKLSNGFNAIGFSQGNAVIRGYIIKYNDPPVKNFMSIDGVCAGVEAFVHCDPYPVNSTSSNLLAKTSLRSKRTLEQNPERKENPSFRHFCMMLEEISSKLSYTTFMQKHLFPSNYFRDPHPAARDAYLKYSLLAKYANQGGHFNQTFIDNFLSVHKFMWVMGLGDTTVIPRELEHWGQIDPTNFHELLPMEETHWFKTDSFGLKSAYDLGKFAFANHTGAHIQIPPSEYQSLIEHVFEATKS